VRPLERLPTIRSKLGSVIVFAVAMTLILSFFFTAYALRNSPRDSEVLALLDAARRAGNGKLEEIPPGTMVVYRTVDGGILVKGLNLGVTPPVFDDEQAHWGITQGLEYVAVPRVSEGVFLGTDYVMRPAPDRGLAGRLDSTLGFLQQQWWQLVAAGVIAAIISLLLARVFALGMTKPLREMAQAAKRMAMGDYSQRVQTRSRDEVGQLAVAFNRMSDELANVEQLRRDLVGNVSHELKTPITALRAHLENVLDGIEEPDPQTLQVMLQQSDRLAALVDQLLELSRLESGDLPLERIPMALGPLVDEVTAEIRVARGDEVTVHNDVPEALGLVEADPARIHQVLFNLLDNAVRFTPPGGAVTVVATKEEDRCVVRVADTGPGIAPEHLPRVFERFYRVDPARSREGGGTGIGLAIARSVVEAHGGEIRAESSVGGGSVFTFDLPMATEDGRNA
jgi:signal transduction histidine kinase